jgi:hypothetical protein
MKCLTFIAQEGKSSQDRDISHVLYHAVKVERPFQDYSIVYISRHPVTTLSELGFYLKRAEYEVGENDFYLRGPIFY